MRSTLRMGIAIVITSDSTTEKTLFIVLPLASLYWNAPVGQIAQRAMLNSP